MDRIAPFREFIIEMTLLFGRKLPEQEVLAEVSILLKSLISSSAWLPDSCAIPHPKYYQQYLLHGDPLERFSVVSFVWGPGQKSPIHDHGVWGLIGMLKGLEKGQRYRRMPNGCLEKEGREQALYPGDIEKVGPEFGDIHCVRNALEDEASISIHVYGGNIGGVKRHIYDPVTGAMNDFVSGYSSDQTPNLWDRSELMREHLVANSRTP